MSDLVKELEKQLTMSRGCSCLRCTAIRKDIAIVKKHEAKWEKMKLTKPEIGTMFRYISEGWTLDESIIKKLKALTKETAT